MTQIAVLSSPERRRLERGAEPAPTSCPCCGSSKLSKIGEDVTETLDVVPRQWFVTEHVREKFSCRACEKITQPPAPFHDRARLCRAEPAGDDPCRQISRPSAAY
jgi:transposase